MKLSKWFRPSLALVALGLSTVFATSAHAQQQILQSSTSRKIPFLLVQSSDHISPLTGATVTVTLSKNGASFGAPAGTVSEVGNGWYTLTPTTADTGTLGPLLLHATASNADPVDKEFSIIAINQDDAAGLGLSRLDAAVSTRQATGNVTVGGYASGQSPDTLVWGAGSRSLTDKAGFALAIAPPTLAQITNLLPANFSTLLIGTGGDAGKVTALGGGSGGASASEVVSALLGTELVPGYSVRRALYTGGTGIPVSEGKPGNMTANTASTGPYTASVAPYYQDVVYYRYGEAAPSGTVVWTNRTYYKTDQKAVVGRTAIVGTLPN